MNIFIIEGVVASGKTLFLNDFQHYIMDKHPKATKLFFSEHFTQHPFEKTEEKEEAVVHHFELLITMLEELHRAHQESHFRQKQNLMFVTFERFLLSFLAEGVIDQKTGLQFARRLMKLGCVQIILQVLEDCLKDRILSTLKYRNDDWKAYIDTFVTIDKATHHFSKWQKKLLQTSALLESVIPTKYYNSLKYSGLQLSEQVYNQFIKEKVDDDSSI